MDSPQHTTPPTDWLTVKQSARVMQCGEKLVYREIRSGRLRAAVIGNRRDYRIHRAWIDDYMQAMAKPVEVRTLREVRR